MSEQPARTSLLGIIGGLMVADNLGDVHDELQAVGARALHPTETLLIASATARGVWVRTCSCGLLLLGNTEVDVFVRWREHRDTVARIAAGRIL